MVDLEPGCRSECAALTERIHTKLDTPGYTRGASLMTIPETLEEWRAEHRTARKRADRAERLGYRFATIDRSQHNDAIHAVNTSKQERQGCPMSDGYLTRHNHGPLPAYPCDRHRVHTYGVLTGGLLVAYLTLYRIGALAMVSMILGHGDHLRNDVMYLLAAGMVADQAPQGGYGYYNSHASGTDGLRYYKERIGFRATDVKWAA